MNRKDDIVEEVRAIREQYAAKFDFDLKRIVEDLKKQEVLSHLARLEPVKPQRQPS